MISISLKGGAPAWTGIGDSTEMLPGAASFSRLENLYVSDDGSELRSVPGTRLAAQPFYGQEWSIASLAGTGIVTVTLVSTSQYGDECYLPSSATTFQVYFLGNSEITDGLYTATKVGTNSFSITSSGTPTATNGVVLVQRGSAADPLIVHAMTHVGQRIVGVCETVSFIGGTTRRTNVSAVVSTDALSFDDVPIGSKQAVWGTEEGFVFWPQPTLTGMNTSEDVTTATPFSACANLTVHRRIQVDTIGKRAVIAVPGAGCLYQCDIGAGPPHINARPPVTANAPNHRWTKALGIPQGKMQRVYEDPLGGVVWTTGYYYGFAIGYHDPFTGEVGLPSRTYVYPVPVAGSDDIVVEAILPRGTLAETVGLGVVLYMTGAQTTALAAQNATLYPVDYYGALTTSGDWVRDSAGSNYNFRLNGGWITDAIYAGTSPSFPVIVSPDIRNLNLPGRQPSIELPSPGASAVRVVRGRVVSGGAYPDRWTFHGWARTFKNPNVASGAGPIFKAEVVRAILLPTKPAPTSETHETPCANGAIPASYHGWRFGLTDDALSSGRYRGRLLHQQTPSSATTVSTFDYIRVDCLVGNDTTFTDAYNRSYDLIAEPLRLSFSEEAAPEVSPATNRIDTDSLRGTRVMGLGRAGDSLLVMTERETFLYSWSTAPRQSTQLAISNRFGCAGPSSVVEGPFGVAWLSLEGPCVFSGSGVTWIGEQIRGFWDTVTKDENGEVHYASAVVDEERSLVIWQLRTTAFEGDTVIEHAKERGDTLLLWCWANNTFSTIVPSTSSQPRCMALLPHQDGRLRVSFTFDTSDSSHANHQTKAIFSWDEDAADRLQAAGTATVTARRAAASANVVVGSGMGSIASGDSGLIVSSDGKTCRWFGELTPSSTTTAAASDAEGADWKVGDKAYLGIQIAHMTTHRLRLGAGKTPQLISGFTVRAQVEDSKTFIRMTATDEDGNVSYITNRWGNLLNDGLTSFVFGQHRGMELILDITIASAAKFRIKDISIDVEGGDG